MRVRIGLLERAMRVAALAVRYFLAAFGTCSSFKQQSIAAFEDAEMRSPGSGHISSCSSRQRSGDTVKLRT